jgi:hypothetical protein
MQAQFNHALLDIHRESLYCQDPTMCTSSVIRSDLWFIKSNDILVHTANIRQSCYAIVHINSPKHCTSPDFFPVSCIGDEAAIGMCTFGRRFTECLYILPNLPNTPCTIYVLGSLKTPFPNLWKHQPCFPALYQYQLPSCSFQTFLLHLTGFFHMRERRYMSFQLLA